MKTCYRCGKDKVADSTNFRKNNQKKDGLNPTCKECVLKKERKKYDERNKNIRKRWSEDLEFRESRMNSAKQWKSNNKEAQLKWRREYYEDNKKEIFDDVRKFRKNNPEESNAINRAGSAVNRALKSGLISRPDKCSWCNRSDYRIEAAHHDYDLPLDILWLCKSCHGKWDKELPKLSGIGIDVIYEYFYGSQN